MGLIHRLRWLRPAFRLALGVPCLFNVLGRFGRAAIPLDKRHSVRRDNRGPDVDIFCEAGDVGNWRIMGMGIMEIGYCWETWIVGEGESAIEGFGKIALVNGEGL